MNAGKSKVVAPNDTAYTQWSCHSGLANPVQIGSTGGTITVFGASRASGPTGWLAMLLIKAGDVEIFPFGMLCLSAISMMFVKILLAVCILVGMVV